MKKDNYLYWRVNTAGLLQEIGNNGEMAVMRKPLMIFMGILSEVAKRASELNDPKMNSLMARLALYEITDPYNKEYDEVKTDQLIHYEKIISY